MVAQNARSLSGSQAKGTRGVERDRRDIADLMQGVEHHRGQGHSERKTAEVLGVPRSTLQYWQARKDNIDADPQLVEFFESPIGLAFLHRLMIALHFVFTLVGPGSPRLISLFLGLTGLQAFVASSHGSQHKVSKAMNREVAEFEQQQVPVLAAQMEPKKITVCPDETFHPLPCLVAIEPVSNYILVEEYAAKRDAATWSSAMQRGLNGLQVEVIQSTSDEGSGILAYVKGELGAHHSPDLFHAQQDLTRATAAPLAARIRREQETVAKAQAETQALRAKKQQWDAESHGPGRPPGFDKRISEAEARQKQAELALETARERQEAARTVIRNIGQTYHPVDLAEGVLLSPAEVARRLYAHFDEIRRIAAAAGLSDRSKRLIAKARRRVQDMHETLRFFGREAHQRVASLGLAEQEAHYALHHLVVAAYLQRAASKAPDADTRQRLRHGADELMEWIPESLSATTVATLRQSSDISRAVDECADLFQRSSSCVEGRNGRLSLHHHSLHRLNPDKLKALTVVHNFFIQRPDGTTAAERFFGTRPPDLFEWLINRLDIPARPARKRRRTGAKLPRAA